MTDKERTPKPPGSAGTAWLVARYQMPLVWSRRGMVPSLLVMAAPVAIAAIVASRADMPAGNDFFFGMVQGYFIQFAVGVLMLGIGLAGFPADEGNGTLSYLLTKPVPRRGILFGRLASACITGSLLVLVSCSTAGIVLGTSPGIILGTWPALLAATLHYGVVFTVLPLVTRRAAAVGLIYVLVWESVLSVIPGAIHTFTATYYIRALLPSAATRTVASIPFLAFLTQPPTTLEAVARLVLTAAAAAAAGGVLLARREYSASRGTDEGA